MCFLFKSRRAFKCSVQEDLEGILAWQGLLPLGKNSSPVFPSENSCALCLFLEQY